MVADHTPEADGTEDILGGCCLCGGLVVVPIRRSIGE